MRAVYLDHGLDESLDQVEGIWTESGVPPALDQVCYFQICVGYKEFRKLLDAEIAIGVLVKATEDLIDLGVQEVGIRTGREKLSQDVLEVRKRD